MLEIVLVLAAAAIACALPGAFLVLRKMSLVSDAISHVLLLGIVLAFLITQNVESPWLMIGAAATGVLTVALVETLQGTRLVKEDAAIGLVFPALFALGALLVSMFSRNLHLDLDSVLLGQPAFADQPRWTVFGQPLKPLWLLTALALLNVALLTLFYKELKLSTFDPSLAWVLGFAPEAMHYGLMTVVSLTAIICFDAAGAVLMVAFFIVPPAGAYLLTNRLGLLLMLSAFLAAAAAVTGGLLAFELNTNIPGSVAVVMGIFFAGIFLLAPERGMIARGWRRLQQRRRFHEMMLLIHLLQHEGQPEEAEESRIESLHRHLGWDALEVGRLVGRVQRAGWVKVQDEMLKLTEAGRQAARQVFQGPA